MHHPLTQGVRRGFVLMMHSFRAIGVCVCVKKRGGQMTIPAITTYTYMHAFQSLQYSICTLNSDTGLDTLAWNWNTWKDLISPASVGSWVHIWECTGNSEGASCDIETGSCHILCHNCESTGALKKRSIQQPHNVRLRPCFCYWAHKLKWICFVKILRHNASKGDIRWYYSEKR